VKEANPPRKTLPSTQDIDLTGVLPDEILKEPIETFVAALGDPSEFPAFAIGMCALRYTEAAPLLRATLERAATNSLRNDRDDLVFFRGLHIIAGRRDPLCCEPLLRLLSQPEEELDALLGDAVSQSLPQIVIGVYDGNADALFEAITDQRRDDLVRDSLLRAVAFITWEGRIERARTITFLERFDRDRVALDGEVTWDAWAMTIALLGLRDMVPLVETAERRGVFDEDIWDRKHFDDVLAEAERAPDDASRFTNSLLGYIEDVVVILQQYTLDEDEAEEDDDSLYSHTEPGRLMASPMKPAVNPFRNVGRNDPCPCGSGKKAKRCCLRS
jgi:hypothetical protein